MKNKMYVSTQLLRAIDRRARVRPGSSPLSSPKIGVKLFFVPGLSFEPREFIAIFQRWIREGTLASEQMIDVVRYRHVKDGPWVMLVGAASHYTIDGQDGRPGLRYMRRRRANGSAGERLRSAFVSAIQVAQLLEKDSGLRFATDELELAIDDRLLAPNTRETFEQVQRELRPFSLLLFEGAEIDPLNATSPSSAFRVRIRAGRRRTLEELRERLEAMRARALLLS